MTPFEQQAKYLLRAGFAPVVLPAVMLSIRRLPRGQVTSRILAPLREVPVFTVDAESQIQIIDVRRVISLLARSSRDKGIIDADATEVP